MPPKKYTQKGRRSVAKKAANTKKSRVVHTTGTKNLNSIANCTHYTHGELQVIASRAQVKTGAGRKGYTRVKREICKDVLRKRNEMNKADRQRLHSPVDHHRSTSRSKSRSKSRSQSQSRTASSKSKQMEKETKAAKNRNYSPSRSPSYQNPSYKHPSHIPKKNGANSVSINQRRPGRGRGRGGARGGKAGGRGQNPKSKPNHGKKGKPIPLTSTALVVYSNSNSKHHASGSVSASGSQSPKQDLSVSSASPSASVSKSEAGSSPSSSSSSSSASPSASTSLSPSVKPARRSSPFSKLVVKPKSAPAKKA